MTHDSATASPTPDHTRRGGSGPEGRPDRTDEYVISVGDVLTGDAPEPPAGTEIELGDGSRWKRIPVSARGWPFGVGQERQHVKAWRVFTEQGPVTVTWVPPTELAELEQRPEYAMWRDNPGQWRPVTWHEI